MKNPDFTIILPTYNRPTYIVLSILSVLNQDYKNFELLVLDDASTDNTEEVVKSFKDARIRYVKNSKNIGYGQNLIQGFKLAKGKYIFLLSDDDIILKQDTLSTIFSKMEETQVGYAQMGLMYYEDDYYKPTAMDHVATELIHLKPSPDILIKTLPWHFGCISGNIFKRDLVKEGDIIDDVWWPYFRAIYRAITSKGAIYFGHHFIIARISTTGLIAFLDIQKKQRVLYE